MKYFYTIFYIFTIIFSSFLIFFVTSDVLFLILFLGCSFCNFLIRIFKIGNLYPFSLHKISSFLIFSLHLHFCSISFCIVKFLLFSLDISSVIILSCLNLYPNFFVNSISFSTFCSILIFFIFSSGISFLYFLLFEVGVFVEIDWE